MLDSRRAYTAPFRIREIRDDPDPDPFEVADFELSLAIWEHLQAHYPGHPWEVVVEHRTGMASIYLQGFSHWGYHIHIRRLAADPSLRIVTKGGGEMLERFKLPRSGLDFGSFLAAQNIALRSNPNRRPD